MSTAAHTAAKVAAPEAHMLWAAPCTPCREGQAAGQEGILGELGKKLMRVPADADADYLIPLRFGSAYCVFRTSFLDFYL